MKDLRIVAKIYNNQLRERREALGLTQTALAEKAGISLNGYSMLESMSVSPTTSGLSGRGKRAVPIRWRKLALDVARFFGVEPSVLFPESAQAIRQRKTEIRVNAEEMALALAPPIERSPIGLLEAGEEVGALRAALETLTQRERLVLERRFGLDDGIERTYAEVGDEYEVCRERIRQIEARALRKLRANTGLSRVVAE